MAEETTNKKRPALLTVLCILSFIGSGFGVLMWLLLAVGIGSILGFLDSIPGFSDALAGSGATGVGISVPNLVLNGGTLAGAIMMWQLKKLGFWIYSGAFVLQFILPLFLMDASFSIFGLIIMALFITLYGLNLKHME